MFREEKAISIKDVLFRFLKKFLGPVALTTSRAIRRPKKSQEPQLKKAEALLPFHFGDFFNIRASSCEHFASEPKGLFLLLLFGFVASVQKARCWTFYFFLIECV